MFGRPRESLRQLIRSQHEESKSDRAERDAAFKSFCQARDEKFERYLAERDEQWRLFWEKLERKSEARQAELNELRKAAEAQAEETREFNREILLRNEKVYKAVIVELEKGAKQLEEGTKQIQANTKAVLSVLDRFNGSGGLAA